MDLWVCTVRIIYTRFQFVKSLISFAVIGVSLFKILAFLTGPFAVLKALISVMHAYVAGADLAAVDVRERQEKRQKAEPMVAGKKLE